MAQQTAITRFVQVYYRGQNMVQTSLDFYNALNKTSGIVPVDKFNQNNFYPEVCRGGIVTVVAAFDAYFTFRFSECVVPLLKKEGPSDGLVKLLSDAGMDLHAALGLLHMARPYRRIRSLVESHFSEYTTQKFTVIDELYLALGLKNFTDNVQKKSKRKTLKSSVQHLIRRRHAIVHSGDIDRHGKARMIDPYQILKKMDDAKKFVDNAELIVNSRMKKK
ncbi:HEPN domain-containing protein [Pontiellaceae bacterium B12219]|nr:HEPN domain-containing protein [Pontiellaceae bacterium B12219]